MPTPIANTWFNQAYYQETPDAFWRLNDAVGAGIADDQSLNSLTGAVVGGVTFGQTGWPSDGTKAALFNGTTGYLNVGNVVALAYTSRFSVLAAFKTTDATHTMAIVGKATSTGLGWLLLLVNGAVRFVAKTSGGGTVFSIDSPAATYADGNYHFVVAVYDTLNSTVKIYIDGSSVISAVPAGTIDSNSARFLIGAQDNAGVGTNFWNGTLDELAVYGYAFTASQVTALTAARTATMNGKALMQARAAISRAGASRSGFYTSRNIVLINGSDFANFIWKGTLAATDILDDQPDTATLTLYVQPGQTQNGGFYAGGFYSGGFFTGIGAIAPGLSITLADGAANNPYFSGTIVKLRNRSVKTPSGQQPAVRLYDIWAMDGTWKLNRRTVTKSYPAGTLANVVVADLVTNYSSGFTINNVQAGAPALTAPLVLKAVKIADAIVQVCRAVSPNWRNYVDPNNDVHFFLTEASQRPKSIVPGVYSYDALDYTLDLTQIRTRMVIEGGGASATAPTAAGATSIPVDECGWYSASGGTLVTPSADLVTYTGRSATSGPGNLTGVPASGAGSITVALLQGDALHVWVQVDDAASQTTLAAFEGGDGIHEQPLSNGNWNIAECTAAGVAELAAYAGTNITGTLWSRDKLMRSGKILSIALPARDITVDVTIQQVKRTLMTVNTFQFDVTFGTVWRNLVAVMQRVGKAA